MHPAYFETRFRLLHPTPFPSRFAILSAYATTGEVWTEEKNQQADSLLEASLRNRGVWFHRIIGYSPSTQHAEPSWCVDLPFEEAISIGLEFHQDAIYWVQDGSLLVTDCKQVELLPVSPFLSRLDSVP